MEQLHRPRYHTGGLCGIREIGLQEFHATTGCCCCCGSTTQSSTIIQPSRCQRPQFLHRQRTLRRRSCHEYKSRRTRLQQLSCHGQSQSLRPTRYQKTTSLHETHILICSMIASRPQQRCGQWRIQIPSRRRGGGAGDGFRGGGGGSRERRHDDVGHNRSRTTLFLLVFLLLLIRLSVGVRG